MVLKASFKVDLGRAILDKIFINVKVSFPVIVKNLTRFCHKRSRKVSTRNTANPLLNTPLFSKLPPLPRAF